MTTVTIEHLSHSQLIAFQSCPRQWTYSHILRVERERTAVPLVFGSAVHAGVAAIHEAALSGDPRPALSFSALVAAELTPERAPVDDPTDLAAASSTGQALLDRYQPPVNIIGVEQAIEVDLAADLPPVVGRIDLIRRLDSGGLAIADVKTSSSKLISDTHAVAAQLGLYHLAYPAEAHEAIVLGKLKTPTITVQPIVPWSRDRVIHQYRSVYRAMQAGADYPNPGWHCAGCAFADRCRRDCGRSDDALQTSAA